MASKPMRVAVATNGEKGLEDSVAHEFGRCKTFTMVSIEGGEVKGVEVMRNPGASLSHGKGPVAAKHLANMGADMAISGEFGPGASTMLEELKIKRALVEPGRKVIDALKEKGLINPSEPKGG